MKIIQANNAYSIEMSENEWAEIGNKNQWTKTAQSNETYQNEANVTFYLTQDNNTKSVLNAKTLVTFYISMEARSWGIKSANVSISNISPVTTVVEDFSRDDAPDQDITIQIDATRLKTETQRKGSITTGEIELWLNPDMSVNYDKSQIEVFEL